MEAPNPQLSALGTRRLRRKSGVIVPNSPKWHQRLGAWITWAALRLIAATLRYHINDPHGFTARKDCGQAIYCIWHNRLALSMKLYFVFGRRYCQSAGLAGLVSASKDGAFLAATLERFGVLPVRGSSSRRGPQALLELTTWAERGYDLAITPDGPRGPRYVVQEGAMSLAQITGLPVVPVSYYLGWKIQANSWDRFQIPLPFSRCEVTVGHVLRVPREATDAEREALRQQLEADMVAISRD
ncbi:MAG TPA: lysophospholipid acyltransferase family protein [Candidatus Limnocylindrales bacterium]|nr:lysophospholipid acyltransferase family protein [Candidatus Limnocylindrales bacterium]